MNFRPTTKVSITVNHLWMYDSGLKFMVDKNIIEKPLGWDDRFKRGKFIKKVKN